MSNLITPAHGSSRRTFANIITDGADNSPVALDTEGTLDWCFFGDLSTITTPFGSAGATNPARKRNGDGELWKGYRWRWGSTGASVFNQASGRFFTASAANNARGDNLNSDNAMGTFGSALGEMNGCGPCLCIPVHRQLRRLKVYTVLFSAIVTCRARIINQEGDDGKDLIEVSTRSSNHFYQTWTIDFASHFGGLLFVDVLLTTMLTSGAHIKLQAATLSVAP